MLEAQWSRGNFVCVGLDSEFGKIPESARRSGNECDVSVANTVVAFNRAIVEATKDLVCAYKPNSAFYEAHGDEGIGALQRTIADIHAIAPDVPVILDAKRADIGNTNAGYVDAAFGFLRADAITVHPYLGAEALQPFLARAEKGIIVLCRTSNPGAGEFQDLSVNGEPLYRFVARRVASEWNKNGNRALLLGGGGWFSRPGPGGGSHSIASSRVAWQASGTRTETVRSSSAQLTPMNFAKSADSSATCRFSSRVSERRAATWRRPLPRARTAADKA